MTKREWRLPYGLLVTIWWWGKADARQKKPTSGIGWIVERR